jgi:hypothetical protein
LHELNGHLAVQVHGGADDRVRLDVVVGVKVVVRVPEPEDHVQPGSLANPDAYKNHPSKLFILKFREQNARDLSAKLHDLYTHI